MKVKPLPKIIFLVALVIGAIWAVRNYGDKIMPNGKNGVAARTTSSGSVPRSSNGKNVETIDVGVVTWGGYVGGQYFNGGFAASEQSRYFSEYGLKVNFILMDDPEASLNAWKAGEIDVHWWTFDSFPMLAQGLSEFNPVFIMQADWSRGGDVCVANRNIQNVSDLRGKKVAVAFSTPSHSGLLNMLRAGDVAYGDVQVVEAASAIDAASFFKSGKVDAAMVWSPDDADCIANVPGAHALWTSRNAPFVIADGFFAKAEYVKTHQEALRALVEGWLRGAAEINTNASAKAEAAQILSVGLNQPLDFCAQAINNARLCTFGDNVNTFNLQGTYRGVTAEDLYAGTASMYEEIGLLRGTYPNWRQVFDGSVLRSIHLDGAEHDAEGQIRFAKASKEAESTPAFATKQVSVSFGTSSSMLDDNAKTVIDVGFADIAKKFASMRIRIEGNTDATGALDVNMLLSKQRAQSVANYLAETYRFDPNRFVIVGNGPNNPVADNGSPDGRAKNRRTDFELIAE